MKEMTTGNPLRQLTAFAIPMLLGSIFQQIYSVADTIIVGRFLGEAALAGVGGTGTLTFFLLAFVTGLGNGAGLIIAQAFGCRDTEKMRSTVTALLWIGSGFTLVIALLGAAASRPLLTLLGVPDDVMAYSLPYLRIILLFSAGSIVYNGASSILRSVGDSVTPLYALALASVLNISLDLLFILVLHLGVTGAALATVISQLCSAVLCAVCLIRKRQLLGLSGLSIRPEAAYVRLIVKTGFPAAFQSCMISLGGMSVQRLVNSYGAPAMAAYAAANRIDSMAIQVIVSFGTALSVFTGQNMGAGNFDRIKKGLHCTLLLMMISSVSLALFVLCFRFPLMKLFLDSADSAEAVSIGAVYLSIIGVAYIIAGIMQSYQNIIRGAGDVNTCMVAGLTELAGRIVFAYLLAPLLGTTGIWLATPLSWSCGCIIPVLRYYSGKWKTKRL